MRGGGTEFWVDRKHIRVRRECYDRGGQISVYEVCKWKSFFIKMNSREARWYLGTLIQIIREGRAIQPVFRTDDGYFMVAVITNGVGRYVETTRFGEINWRRESVFQKAE